MSNQLDGQSKAGSQTRAGSKALYPALPYVPGLAMISLGVYDFLGAFRRPVLPIGCIIQILLGLWFIFVADTARRVVQMYRHLWSGPHVYRDATERDLAKLDRSFYERSTAALEGEGFHRIDDVVNVTVSSGWPQNHAVLRHLLGDHQGITMCAVYHVRLYGLVGLLLGLNGSAQKLKVVECDTELSDGTYVTTANNLEMEKTGRYPFQDRLQLVSATPAVIVAQEHRIHLQSVLQQKQPTVAPIPILDGIQLAQSQGRLHLKKCAHRKSPGFNYKAEWESVAGRQLRPGESPLVNRIAREMSSHDVPAPNQDTKAGPPGQTSHG